MRRPAAFALTPPIALAIVLLFAARPRAQDPPPPISRFVVDLRGSFPKFSGDQQLADSRALDVRQLPGIGLGVDVGAHVHLFKWKAITFGLGGQVTLGRSRSSPIGTEPRLSAVTERFTSFAPQLSFNFGTGDGWSYLSGGIGQSTWSIVPDRAPARPSDEERLRTINYGGGARWFIKRRLAFTVDARFYALDPGTPQGGLAGSPRTTLLIIGAGISLK
jgi:hypothetical protein